MFDALRNHIVHFPELLLGLFGLDYSGCSLFLYDFGSREDLSVVGEVRGVELGIVELGVVQL